MTTPETPAQPRLAAIDVGTNTIRLTVAEVQADDTYRILDEEREMVRLGENLDRTGRLSEAAIQRALTAIGKMKAIADGFKISGVRAIATSAVREAANGRNFIREVSRQHKVRIDVISGEEEAQLAFRTAARHFDFQGRSTAVVDIGGGSVEVILSAGTAIDHVYSLPLGAVRVTDRLMRSDPLRPKHWKQMKDEIDRGIKSILRQPHHRAEIMIGSGGTFTALAHMSKFQREGRHGSVQGYVLTPAEIIHLLRRLRETPLEGRRQIPGLSPDRADIIVAGAAVISRLVRGLGSTQIMVNERGIRDGLLLRMIAELPGRNSSSQLPQPGNRIEWARHFARKAHSNERHCEHVAGLALQIFDGVKNRFDLPEAGRDLLHAAAILHDIGYLISHAKHHKHAYHLIMHGDLPGFTPHEVELIANVVRYHRRAFPRKRHENLAYLDRTDRQLITRLSGILRIADGLDRTHSQSVTAIKIRALRGRLRMSVEAKTLPEIEVADAARKSDLFRRAFDTEVELAWHPLRSRSRMNGGPRGPRLHVVAAS
ncbi:MAG TPA: Ppx/GppA phosphatase family protein [Gemmatimonadales bacterium]|nr:Ppx/GppA phosphatase family protein [Gemmatimonadales bacterium]